MKLAFSLLAGAAALSLTTAALAQSTSTSGSTSGANSGSASEANNANQNGQTQSANNAGIGNSTSTSGSAANANASTASNSAANGNMQGQGQTSSTNQGQGQTQGANNTQSQGQTANNGQTQTQGQMATNSQGTTVSNTFNSTIPKRTYVSTNTAVPLVASSSFSSDYCGGTVSGGASVAPIGVSIGASGPKMDDSCQYLRVAEKAGMLAANYGNLHQDEAALKAEALMSWAVCMAGPKNGHHHREESETSQVCMSLGLMGSAASAPTPPAVYVPPAPVTPPEAVRAEPPAQDYTNLPPKTPRGDATQALPTPIMATPTPMQASATTGVTH